MVPGDETKHRVRFHVGDLAEQLLAFAARWPGAVADADGGAFLADDARARLRLPPLAARAEPGERIRIYAQRGDAEPGSELILLLRAGAVAFGLWQRGELVAHKAERKYVVRGHGRAQPTHRRAQGPSRYGARLRLQNWRRLLTETNERLGDLWSRFGAPDRVFWSAPVRVWSDLHAAEPPPPFDRDDRACSRLPLHVHRPDHGELLRVRGWLELGELELPR